MKRSCTNCQYKSVGYEHTTVCDLEDRIIFDKITAAENCEHYKEYNRWDSDGS